MSSSVLQGIELKEAASNPLLGQFHMHNDHGFVRAKLQAKNNNTEANQPVGF